MNNLRFKFIVLVLVGIVFFGGCQVADPADQAEQISIKKPDDKTDYGPLWTQVNALIGKNLPKSAIEIIEKIYSTAKTNDNIPQLIKALIYKFYFLSEVEEDSLLKFIADITGELKKSRFPLAPLLHSIRAQILWQYYEQNRYQYLDRTATVDYKEDDIKTWDLRKIVNAVIDDYESSLKDAELAKKYPIDWIDPILSKGNKPATYRPYLFDFLAHRAIDFFSTDEANLPQPATRFSLNKADFFIRADKFKDLDVTTTDTLSFQFRAIKILQELIRFHYRDEIPDALVDVDLKRLKFVYTKGIIDNKVEIYEKSLRLLADQYEGKPIVTEILYALASLYHDLGNKYEAGGDDLYKWHKKKAYEICGQAFQKYPDSAGGKNCRCLQARIESRAFKFHFEKVSLPRQPFKALVEYTNIKRIYFYLIATNFKEIRTQNRLGSFDMIRHFLKKKPDKNWFIDLPDDGDFQGHKVEIKMDGLEPGEYVIFASDDKSFEVDDDEHFISYSFFKISSLAYLHRQLENGSLEFQVVDRQSGQPLENASIQLWYDQYDQQKREYFLRRGKLFQADETGHFKIARSSINRDYFYLEFIYEQETLFSEPGFNLYKPYKQSPIDRQTFFFTDRAIYRPGQTVYFKGIVLEINEKANRKNRPLAKASSLVTFYDVNSQKIHQLSLMTNEYGTFSGTFAIPMGLINGTMRIADNYGATWIQVEEYKRPKFKVEFDPLPDTYRLNDRVLIKGKAVAYAGFNIDGAQVKYRVVRRTFFPYTWEYWYRQPETEEMEILNGLTQTDAAGRFEVSFPALPDLAISRDKKPAFTYSVYADVTDINGETRSQQKDVTIGYTALTLAIDLPEQLDSLTGKRPYKLQSANLSGDFVPCQGKIEISRLKNPRRPFRERLWSVADKFLFTRDNFYKLFPWDLYDDENNSMTWPKEKTVFTLTFNTADKKEIVFPDLAKWPVGKYVAELTAKDRYGQNIIEKKYFSLFSSDTSVLPYPMLEWFAPVKMTAEPGEKAVFVVGSSAKDVCLIYEIEQQNKIIEKKILVLNNEQKKIEVQVKENHRGNLGIHLAFVKYNRYFSTDAVISVPWSNKELAVSIETFRDKLVPGQKEEWRLKIRGRKGDLVAAEMVATLYDASLDAFRFHGWYFSPFSFYYPQYSWNSNYLFNPIQSSSVGEFTIDCPVSGINDYDLLNWFDYYHNRRYRNTYAQTAMKEEIVVGNGVEGGISSAAMPATPAPMQKGRDSFTVLAVAPGVMSEKKKADGDDETGAGKGQATPGEVDLSAVKARKDFNETAFFYPHLETDKDGTIVIAFTIPEALTRWKMLGLAHSKNLEYKMITKELVTQKDLMVVPNPPRFFRQGDQLVFTAKVTNLSEKELKGQAQFQLFDAASMKPVDDLFANQDKIKPFSTPKGQSAQVNWKIQIPDEVEAVTYRLVAKAGNFSDGEEQAIPILKNRMLVTESMPLPLKPSQTKDFTFDKLVESGKSTTLKHHRLTLEFTANPVWYAVQALPVLMEFPHECVEQLFSRYYANSIAAYIVNSRPNIKRIFELWKNDPGQNALLSNLEKNQELKGLMLEETPWVLDAKNENVRKKRIALLFDINRMKNELDLALKKILDAQLPSGGWPWFKGMRECQYITQHIVNGFAHLDRLKVIDLRKNEKIWPVLKEALIYLDSEIQKDYDWLIRNKISLDQNNLGYMHIHYLYGRSCFRDVPVDDKYRKAYDYYLHQAEEYWPNFNKYSQGMIALALYRNDKKSLAGKIVDSIREYALYSEEMGMYWKESYGYYWYEAPIETHALLIEVFAEIANDDKAVNDMKTWLLKQKQTQDWRTTKATAEALYALLLRGGEWLAAGNLPDIKLGNMILDLKKDDQVKIEAGTGYFKTSWSGGDIKPEMGRVQVKNNNNIPAWGSLYWQYFENLDKITPAKTPLQLEKKLFVEMPSSTGPVIKPVEPNTQLKIGDRLKVRIVLRVDRNMEFVHMKDMRASGFEPENVISSYKWQDNLGYYESTKDAATHFFFDYLPKGTYVFEYPLRVTHEGDFANGITTIHCMYAPEFSSHSEGIRVEVSR